MLLWPYNFLPRSFDDSIFPIPTSAASLIDFKGHLQNNWLIIRSSAACSAGSEPMFFGTPRAQHLKKGPSPGEAWARLWGKVQFWPGLVFLEPDPSLGACIALELCKKAVIGLLNCIVTSKSYKMLSGVISTDVLHLLVHSVCNWFFGSTTKLDLFGEKKKWCLASLANGFALMPHNLHNEMPPKNSGAKISGFYWKTMAPPALVKKEKKIFLLLPQQMFFLCKIRASGRGKTFFSLLVCVKIPHNSFGHDVRFFIFIPEFMWFSYFMY